MRRHWRRIISWHPVPLCHFPTCGREVTELRPQWGRSLGEMPSQIIVDQWSANSPCDCSFSAKQLLSQWDRSSRQVPARKFVAHWATITNQTNNFGPVGQNYLPRNFVSSGDKVSSSAVIRAQSIIVAQWATISQLRAQWARSSPACFNLSTTGR